MSAGSGVKSQNLGIAKTCGCLSFSRTWWVFNELCHVVLVVLHLKDARTMASPVESEATLVSAILTKNTNMSPRLPGPLSPRFVPEHELVSAVQNMSS